MAFSMSLYLFKYSARAAGPYIYVYELSRAALRLIPTAFL